MEINMNPNGEYYAETSFSEDFRNAKAKRQYERNKKKISKKLKKLNRSAAIRRMKAELESVIRCDECGSKKVVSWGKYRRKARYYLSKKVKMVQIQRFRCKKCGKTKSLLPRFLTRLRRFANNALRDMVDAKLWFFAGYRKIAKWSRIGGCSHT